MIVSYYSLKFFYLLQLRIVFDITNALICFFYLPLLLLLPSFVVRLYDDINLIIPLPIKYHLYQEIGTKVNNQFLAKTGDLDWHLNLQEKQYLNKVIIFVKSSVFVFAEYNQSL